MWLTPLQVECTAGYKADEAPRRLLWEGTWLEVVEVVDRWHQATGNPEWPMADDFKVLAADHHEYLLKHDRESDDWYLARRW
jgi:hypothetical protein